jgi:hypothetical protein
MTMILKIQEQHLIEVMQLQIEDQTENPLTASLMMIIMKDLLT